MRGGYQLLDLSSAVINVDSGENQVTLDESIIPLLQSKKLIIAKIAIRNRGSINTIIVPMGYYEDTPTGVFWDLNSIKIVEIKLNELSRPILHYRSIS
jgi:hypothetical protein